MAQVDPSTLTQEAPYNIHITFKGRPRDHTQEDPCALTPEVNSAHTQEVQRDQAQESLRALIKGIPTCPRTRRATCPRVDPAKVTLLWAEET